MSAPRGRENRPWRGYLRATSFHNADRCSWTACRYRRVACVRSRCFFQSPELAVNPRWKIRDILTEVHGDQACRWSHLGVCDSWLDRLPHELSGGELQRICIARAVGPAVRFLIADEISGMLDTVTQAEIWQALLDYASQANIGILAISHDVSLLEKICVRILALEKGSTSIASTICGDHSYAAVDQISGHIGPWELYCAPPKQPYEDKLGQR